MPSRAELAGNPKGGFQLTKERKRLVMMALMGVAGAALLLAVLTTVLLEDATPWLVASLAVLALAVAAELVLLVWGDSREFDKSGEWYDWEKAANKAGGRDMLLRCTGCSKTFTVKDTGERPLRTSCTHCGKTGVLKATAPKR